MLKFGSVCSGIEAATVAWRALGWRATWYAEIEKFPSRVLAARHPETPNLGDMTKLEDSEVYRDSNLDVLVGGTPCQSFSIAGLRKGLADPRGNLALVFLGLIDRKRPRWVVWENVPGVLSSWSDAEDRPAEGDVAGGSGDLFGGLDGGGNLGGSGHEDVVQTNDFDTFTRGLSELGYGVAWAVLDAQHFGVPQRRERVFVVAHLGALAPAAAVLFDRHCLCGHPAPRRAAGEDVAGTLRAGAGGGCGPGPDEAQAHHLIAKPLLAHHPRIDPETENFVAHTLRSEGFDASEDGTGRGTPIVPVDLTNARLGQGDVAGTMEAAQDRGNRGQGVLQPQLYSIMPQNSGKDYKARPVEVAQPLMAAGPGTGAQGGDVIVVPTPAPSVLAFSAQDHGNDIGNDISPTVRKGGEGGGVQPAVCIPIDMRQASRGEKMTNNRPEGSSGGAPGTGVGSAGDPAPTILSSSHVPAVFDMRGNGDGDNVPTLTGHHAGAISDFSPMVFEPRYVRNGRGAPGDVVPPLKAQSGETGKGDGAPVVLDAQAFMENQRGELRVSEVTDALKGSGGKPSQGFQAAVVEDAVRRLTPRECERLQGFPDDYTLIPGGNRTDDEDYAETVEYLLATGWPTDEAMALADTPDGPRYKALGNSMCVDVMFWIGSRIQQVHELLYGKAA